jgi:hypothetical protein
MKAATLAAVMVLGVVAQGQAQEAREPQGLRMQRSADDRHVLLPWGIAAAEAQRLLPCAEGNTLCFGSASSLSCLTSSCTVGIAALSEGWRIDTGDVYLVKGPYLEFHEDKFYEYSIIIPPIQFAALLAILTKALGEPTSSEEVPSQNAYGAEWSGAIRAWDTEKCEVILSTRISSIDEGLLLVTYKPLKPPEKKAEGKAPF